MQQYFLLVLGAIALTACAADNAKVVAAQSGCVAGGGGFLQAQLRGALTANIAWSDALLKCEGGARPDGQGLRVTLAGPLPAPQSGKKPARQLRFIFGIDLKDVAAGSAQAMPTNVTIILEGEGRMFATRGSDRCAVEKLERTPLPGSDAKLERVHVRGYCTEPAAEMDGDARLWLPTFEFTGQVATGDAP
jgi:hypothetical protein